MKENLKIGYEGIFFDNKSIKNAFEITRGECTLKSEPSDYHVTTVYAPKQLSSHLYGEKVIVTCTKYKLDNNLFTKEGALTANEGFKVELSTNNSELATMLANIDKNWHITGSFNDKAVYTNDINFEDGMEVSFSFEGIFAGFSYKYGVINKAI